MTSSVFNGDETAPFFGFLGAAAALIFSFGIFTYSMYERGVAKLVQDLENLVGIQNIRNMGTGADTLCAFGRRRLQRREQNQRHMAKNTPSSTDDAMNDPPDRRGVGRASRPRQKTVRKTVNNDASTSAGPSKRGRRSAGRGISMTQ